MARRIGWAYGVLTLTLAVMYLSVPGTELPTFGGIVVTTVAAVLYGVRRHRPRRRLPWWLLAGGMVCFAVCSVTAVVLSEVLHED